MAEIHYKCTTWCKIIINDKDAIQLIEQLELGLSPLDIYNNNDLADWEVIPETEEDFSISENDNQPTIEVREYQTDSSLGLHIIWDNVNKTHKHD